MNLKIDDIVQHEAFGIGVVKRIESGNLVVDFERSGIKKIAAGGAGFLELLPPDTQTAMKRKLLPGMRALQKSEKYNQQFFDGCWEFSSDNALFSGVSRDPSVVMEWYEKYKEVPEGALFYEEDRTLASGPQRQQGKHFYEWQAAILLYEKYGYLSLNEKYECWARHPEKFRMFSRIAGADFAKYAANNEMAGNERLSNDHRQCPDLLVYKPDLSDWFFCEVKAGEGVTASQKEFFPIVRQRTGKPIYVLLFV